MRQQLERVVSLYVNARNGGSANFQPVASAGEDRSRRHWKSTPRKVQRPCAADRKRFRLKSSCRPWRDRHPQHAAKSMVARDRADIAVESVAKREQGILHAYVATVDTPYMARFRNAGTDKLYRIYLDERPGHAAEAGFYLLVADHLYERGLTELATRVLSNLAEMDLENRHRCACSPTG
jgi:hypothetical protein